MPLLMRRMGKLGHCMPGLRLDKFPDSTIQCRMLVNYVLCVTGSELRLSRPALSSLYASISTAYL